MGNIRERLPQTLLRMRREHRIAGTLAHVGAHDGEEVELYRKAGFSFDQIHLIDPLPDKCERLRKLFPKAHVHQVACSDTDGVQNFHVGSRTNQSSLNRHEDDSVVDVIQVDVRRLDNLVPNAVIAVIDAQGHELEVMRSMPESVRLVFVETSPVPDVSMASTYEDVMQYAEKEGFELIDTWTRDYAWLYQWCRKTKAPYGSGGLVRDLVLLRS